MSGGGGRRWLAYILVVVLLGYVLTASWFARRIYQQEDTTAKLEDKKSDLHIVFSTGCNLFQHWQAEVLLASHFKVGQKGKITRVVSGCDTEKEKRAHGKYLTQ